MTDKPNYYAVIPANVRYADITPNAKLLYAEITALLQMNGVCFATNKYFGKLYNKNKVTISRWLQELKKNNFITITYTYKEDSKEIANRYIQICNDGINKNATGVLTKMLKSNTTINNNIDAEQFVAFYDSKDWFIGKNKMKDWRKAVITWEKRDTKKQTMSKIDKQLNEYLKGKQYL